MSATTEPRAHDGQGQPDHAHGGAAPVDERRLPPIVELGGAALLSVVAGGVHMASHFPRRPPLTVPIILLSIGAVLMLVNVVLLARLRPFAWKRFAIVFKWTLLAYVISAGMIEFAFLKNHTKGGPLVVVSGMLVIFATVVPLMIAFTVARYDEPDSVADTA